jgi:coenzyme F420-dependent glucose-6-phosphate dehydrogenase
MESVVCGPDLDAFVQAAAEFIEAGYDHVYFHQAGPDQDGFLRFVESELLPGRAD